MQAVIIHIDHDSLGRRIELRREQGGEPDGAGANDGDGRARLNLAVEHAAFEAGGQDVTQHDERIFVRACGNVIKTVSANGMRTYSAWVPSILLPRIQPPLTQCEYMPRRQ